MDISPWDSHSVRQTHHPHPSPLPGFSHVVGLTSWALLLQAEGHILWEFSGLETVGLLSQYLHSLIFPLVYLEEMEGQVYLEEMEEGSCLYRLILAHFYQILHSCAFVSPPYSNIWFILKMNLIVQTMLFHCLTWSSHWIFLDQTKEPLWPEHWAEM